MWQQLLPTLGLLDHEWFCLASESLRLETCQSTMDVVAG